MITRDTRQRKFFTHRRTGEPEWLVGSMTGISEVFDEHTRDQIIALNDSGPEPDRKAICDFLRSLKS